MKKKSNGPRSFNKIIESQKGRPVPDIPYFAWRGGLSSTAKIYPYELSSELLDHVHSSNGTQTVQYHLVRGLEKYYFDLRTVEQEAEARGVKLDEAAKRKLFPKLDFVNGLLPTGTPQECAQAALDLIQNRWPVLKEYPPLKQTRKGRRKDELREQRRKAVREADEKGVDVIAFLDAKRIPLPLSWRVPPGWRGSPTPWAFAHNDRPKWRLRVQRELSSLRNS